ncbi:MAG: Gfo/Idh/MocA family oxidoreductase [Chloroflexota bacterium]|nr:Gfo/Idh/MocA family oxidoreductase [Chloroflexota bacterium]MDE2897331.1 Gfo/Idh/MocA family oxidoreductase [Chloroflexota bacterium]
MSFEHGHQYSYLRAMLGLPSIELVAVSEPDPDLRAQAEQILSEGGALKSVRIHTDHQDVFRADDVDAVSICAANAAHHDLTLAAAEAGKHVLCEKPLAVTLADATSMVRGCAEHGVTLATAYPVRHAPPVWEAKRRLASGELGAIRGMSLTNVLGARPSGWFIDPTRSGGGAIRDHIVHATDLMRWFSEAEVAQVYCEAETLARDIPVEDTGALIEVFDSGVIGTCDPSWNRPPTWRRWGDVTGRIVCDSGIVEFDITDYVIRVTSADPGVPYREVSFASNMNAALLCDFAESITTGRPPCADGHDGWAGVACTEAAYASARRHEFVDVPRFR